jgi:hypothetical protein
MRWSVLALSFLTTQELAVLSGLSLMMSFLSFSAVTSISTDEYGMLKKQVDRTKARTADTRNAFELHVEEHGC